VNQQAELKGKWEAFEHNRKIGSNFRMADKSLAVEFRKPRNLLAKFNSAHSTQFAVDGEKYGKENWRREGDSNPRYGF